MSDSNMIVFLYSVDDIKGRLICLDGPISLGQQGQIRPIFDLQLAHRGAEKSFKFKAIGHKWHFERLE